MIIQFSMDSSKLKGVHNSAELMEALHHGLSLEAASPLDFEVSTHESGNSTHGRLTKAGKTGSSI